MSVDGFLLDLTHISVCDWVGVEGGGEVLIFSSLGYSLSCWGVRSLPKRWSHLPIPGWLQGKADLVSGGGFSHELIQLLNSDLSNEEQIWNTGH